MDGFGSILTMLYFFDSQSATEYTPDSWGTCLLLSDRLPTGKLRKGEKWSNSLLCSHSQGTVVYCSLFPPSSSNDKACLSARKGDFIHNFSHCSRGGCQNDHCTFTEISREHRRWTSLFLQWGPENMFLHICKGKDRHRWRMGKDFHDLASLPQCSAQLFWESTSSATFTFSDWGSNLNKYSSLRLSLMRIKEILFLGKFWRGRGYSKYGKRLRVLQRMIMHRGRVRRRAVFKVSVLQFFTFSSLTCHGGPLDPAVLPAILAPQQPTEALWDSLKGVGGKDVF